MSTQAPVEPRLLSYWFLNQLFKNHATVDHAIHIRCIANARTGINNATGRIEIKETKPVVTVDIPWAELHTKWMPPGGHYDRLKALNEEPELPANIYYATALHHRNAHSMTKESCIGYTCSFLDMDVTETWSLQDRYQQINFLHMSGFGPSILIGSGRGLQPIWLWNTRIDTALGEPILKRMVKNACCTEGGNCWDVTRILRLPGFKNVKEWQKGEILDCTVVSPNQDTIIRTNNESLLLPRYNWERFKHFPVCGKDAIATAYREAIQIGADPMRNLEEIAVSVAGHQHAERIQIAADRVKEAQAQPVADPDGSTKETYAPRFNKVPLDFDEIGLKKGHSQWFKLYCTKGFDDLTKGELDKISAKLNISGQASASEFDAKVVYSLIRARYSFEAIDEFWRRPDLRLFREDKFAKNPNYLQLTYDNMMQYYLAAVEQREMQAEEASAALPPNTVFVDGKGLLRISRSADRTDLLLSGNMEVLGHYIDMDEPVDGKQEHYHLKVTDFRQKTEEWTLQRAAFSSVKALKEVCKGDIFVLASHDSDLSHLQYYLNAKNGNTPRGQFHSAVKYIGEENRFAFPHYVIGKDEINMYTNPTILKIMAKHLPICKAWLSEKPDRDAAIREFSRVWPSLLRMHSPRLIVACLGSLMTIAMRQIFQYHEKMDISIPTINFRGSSCSGKTET